MGSSNLIIYIAVGVITVLFVGIGLCLCTRRRRNEPTGLPVHTKSESPEQPPATVFHAQASPHVGRQSSNPRRQGVSDTTASVVDDLRAEPTLAQRKIRFSAIFFSRVVSKGAYGEVWLAHYENRPVAVKRIRQEKRHEVSEIEAFADEIKLMALFQHPKIVEFVGVSWDTNHTLCAVTEFMGRGDLYDFLKKKTGLLNWVDHKLYLAEDIAEAIQYLHTLTPMVIHRDLKSKNILLDANFVQNSVILALVDSDSMKKP